MPARVYDASTSDYRHLVTGLAILPLCDVVMNQVATVAGSPDSGVSLLQIVRGPILAALIFVLISNARAVWAVRRLLWGPVCVTCTLALTAIQEWLTKGRIPEQSAVAYLQALYWLTVWALTTIVCRGEGPCIRILKGLAWGGVVAAACVYCGYVIGGINRYEVVKITSSSGWFYSPKGLAAQLSVGAIATMYVWRERHELTSIVASGVCWGAVFLTYSRAGLVAAVCAMAVFGMWACVPTVGGFQRRWIGKVLVVYAIGACAVVATIGVDDLRARWDELNDPIRPGSGRAEFWPAALDAFVQADPGRQVFGHGYNGMLDAMERRYARIHSHNDLLDALLVGGVVGVTALCLLGLQILILARTVRVRLFEYPCTVALGSVLVAQGLLTGQLFATETAWAAAAITSLAALGRYRIRWPYTRVRHGASAMDRVAVSVRRQSQAVPDAVQT